MASRAFDPRQTQESGEAEPEMASQPMGEDAIAARAYKLWQARGCPIGSPEVDWFQAEQELRSRTDNQKRAPDSEQPPTVQNSTQRGVSTEGQVNMTRTVPERVDKHGSKIEDAAGTGEHDSLGG